MYAAGRALQLLALVVTGVGFFQGVAAGHVRTELALLALGGVLFLAGRLMQARSR